jgi:cobalt-zinc-cadmium efflux system protein
MAHQHGHSQAHRTHHHAPLDATGRVLGGSVALTLAFVGLEALFGWLAHSLALLSDAGHNLTDAAALGFSWYAVRVSERPSHEGMTYGYHRMGIVAALANAASLAVIALVIAWEAVDLLRQPAAPNPMLMIVVAAAAIAVNTIIGVRLHAGASRDINVRSAYLHMVGDAVSALGVVFAGVIIAVTGSVLADPIVSLLIAGLIVWSSYGVFHESTKALMEGTPAGTDMSAVVNAITSVPGVLGVHDLHVWTIGPGVVACSCHILVAEQSVREGQQVLRAVVQELEQHFHITHTTIQVEVEGCASDDMYCAAQRFTASSRTAAR